MRNPAFCLQCDDGTELNLAQRDLAFNYKGKTRVIASVHGWHCPVCGECEFISTNEAERHSAERSLCRATSLKKSYQTEFRLMTK